MNGTRPVAQRRIPGRPRLRPQHAPGHDDPRTRAEQTLRPDKQDHDEHREERESAQTARPRRRPTRATPITSAADDRTADAAKAAENHDRQQPGDEVVVAVRVERVDQPKHRASRGGRRDAEPEAESPRPFSNRRQEATPRSGFGRSREWLALTRAVEEQRESDEQDQRRDEREQPHGAELVAGKVKTVRVARCDRRCSSSCR